MGRIRIEKNISKDEERNVYYINLYYGKDAAGKTVHEYVTSKSLRDENIDPMHQADVSFCENKKLDSDRRFCVIYNPAQSKDWLFFLQN